MLNEQTRNMIIMKVTVFVSYSKNLGISGKYHKDKNQNMFRSILNTKFKPPFVYVGCEQKETKFIFFAIRL
jgi:hypothetical protein